MARSVRLVTLDTAVQAWVASICAAASRVDEVEPLSEAFLLAVASGHDPGSSAHAGVAHLVARDDSGAVVGYGQVAGRGGDGAASAELVVHPDHRHRGHGRTLLDGLLAEGATAVWAHGNLAPARALAAAAGWRMTRSLHLMARSLGPADDVDPDLPPGFTARPFESGRDDAVWLRLNAAAFADHPEQGRMTLADLRERTAQPWFDPAGLLLVEHPDADAPVAFHWTKVDPGAFSRQHASAPAAQTTAGPAGEVYVVGVDPAWQGRGLGAPVTRLGLAHLARAGCTEVRLYVDGGNHAARHTYRRLGFADIGVDGQYTPAGY